MLRYFYLIICIQVCFSSIYVDNNIDYDTLDRRPRSRTTRLNKKQTKKPRNSRLVQFDVQNFMQRPVQDSLDDYRRYGYRNKKRENRFPIANDAGFVETHENTNEQRAIDYSNIDDHAPMLRENTRSYPQKYLNPRNFNFNSLCTTNLKASEAHTKATASNKHNKLSTKKVPESHERRCSFRNMKIPFFSRSKTTPKAKFKRHKKRRIFCFNCKKTTTPKHLTAEARNSDYFNIKTDEISSKDNPTPPLDKTSTEFKKIRKRSYDQLCPKCIKELLANMKKRATPKKAKQTSTTEKTAKASRKRNTTKQKLDLEDSFQDGLYYVGSERIKRNEEEEQDRERRLKELEEVEKKIENVHVAAPNFSRGSLNN